MVLRNLPVKVRQFLSLRRVTVLVAAPVLLIIVLLAVGQLVLPAIAAERLRDRLARSGTVRTVEVDAFPAIELLWDHADHVLIRMRSYHATPRALAAAMSQIAGAASLDATASRLDTGLLTLHDATLTKRGSRLTATAMIGEADLRSSFPILDSVEPIASSGGRLTLQGTATLLGVTANVDVTVGPAGGALVAAPDVPFGGLATVTLFSSPAVEVQGVGASPAPGGLFLSARGRMR